MDYNLNKYYLEKSDLLTKGRKDSDGRDEQGEQLMSEHFCEFDHNLDEPCRKPASIKWREMWFCAEHWDWHEQFCEEIGIDPVFGKGGNEQ